MKITLVERLCEGHGQCVLAAPELFEFASDDDDIVTVLDEHPPEELWAKAREAASLCPTQALRIEEG